MESRLSIKSNRGLKTQVSSIAKSKMKLVELKKSSTLRTK
jgi:hypothetical protein